MNSYQDWTGYCQRCFKSTDIHTMSMFDVELICMKCSEAEKKHPRFKEASLAELEEVKKGNRNFPGIGRPSDLNPGMEWENYPDESDDEHD